MKRWNCPEYAFTKDDETDINCGVCGGYVDADWAKKCKLYQATLNGKTVEEVRADVYREGFLGFR